MSDKYEQPPISIEVVWGDITRAEGDLYIVGHYQGIWPQNAERALDLAVSNQLDLTKKQLKKEEVIRQQVIRQHSRRGCIRGAVGDITYFPWADSDGGQRQVAVVGMGRPGSFGLSDLIRLFRDAFLTISLLPGAKTICTVLIGAGEGGLRHDEAVSGLLQGLAEANKSADLRKSVRQIKIVEITRNKSRDILTALQRQAEQSEIASLVSLQNEETPTKGLGGHVPTVDALQILLDAASRAMCETKDPAQKEAIDTLLKSIETEESRAAAEDALKKFHEAQTDNADGQKKDYVVAEKDNGPVAGRLTHISCLEEGGVLHIAAITNTTTMAEREISPAPDLVRDIVDQVNDPDRKLMKDLPSFLTRLFIPKDFREILSGTQQYVFEVDRTTAQIHWEMLARNLKTTEKPLGVSSCVARQLRTQYSTVPATEGSRHGRGRLTALVIGDPGSVQKEHDLPGAREEALAVRKILKDKGVEVTALIGAADGPRDRIPSDVPPATRLAALAELMHGNYDLLHYAGHGDFDPEAPDQVGWLFERGLLTSHEIRSIDNAPELIFANACLSGRTSEALSADRQVRSARSEVGLLPSLADEFFRLGAWNYIGTSWEVDDSAAVLFAKVFYEHLLSGKPDQEGPTVGKAMLKARNALYGDQRKYGKLWAAYQHYGDPGSRLRLVN
ncbi:MAG: CHAT domain-containing protein [Woeseiaceae bacterium]